MINPNSLTTGSIPLPNQLQREDLIFIPIPRGQKGPSLSGWNIPNNGSKWNDPSLTSHIKKGGNIGCYPAPGSAVIFVDVDDAVVFTKAGGDDIIADTFRYTPHLDGSKYRAVLECSDIPNEWKGRKIASHPLEIFLPAGPRDGEIKAGGQVIIPPSIHPNGARYQATHDKQIQSVAWEQIAAVIDKIKPSASEINIKNAKTITRKYSDNQNGWGSSDRQPLRDRYSLQIEMPLNATPQGEWIIGASPFHDSTTGKNCAVTNTRVVFYCFRHEVAYDAAGCEAIRRGIMECGDEYNRSVYEKLAKELNHDFPEVRYQEKVEYRRQMKNPKGLRA